MYLPLDASTQTRALGIARQLAVTSNGGEGLSLGRELLVGFVNSKLFHNVFQWFEPENPPLGFADVIYRHYGKLPDIIKTFNDSGHGIQAVRVAATCFGFSRAMGQSLIAQMGPPQSGAKVASKDAVAAAAQLAHIGMDILKSGYPEGITLMGAAHQVAPDVALPVADIAANVHMIPYRQPVALEPADAQALTQAAYDLHFSGRKISAMRIGALVPSMLKDPAADQLFDGFQAKAKPGNEPTFRASRDILAKGYAAEAANLLIDSGAVSVDEMWTSLDKQFVGPSPELKTPSQLGFYARSARSGLFGSDVDLGPPQARGRLHPRLLPYPG